MVGARTLNRAPAQSEYGSVPGKNFVVDVFGGLGMVRRGRIYRGSGDDRRRAGLGEWRNCIGSSGREIDAAAGANRRARSRFSTVDKRSDSI
jgi:hypothetical protein